MYSLILSGGGTRGFYEVGVCKALEEYEYRSKIDAIYGVSAGAIVGTLWSAGYSADRIFQTCSSFLTTNAYRLNLRLYRGLVDTKPLTEFLSAYIPDTIEELDISMHIGTTDLQQGEYYGFNSGPLLKPLIASLSVPGVFPPVEYDGKSLVDGGVINGFPIEHAIAEHPNNQSIGVALLFKKNVTMRFTNIIQTLNRSFDLILQSTILNSLENVDLLLSYDSSLSLFDMNATNREKSFHRGYRDGIEAIKSIF